MADKHPYISSGGPLIKAINQLRNSLPSTIDADTLKKLGLAPNNESYVISTLRFIGIVDEDDKSTDQASDVLTQHDDKEFQEAFGALVESGYSELFSTHGANAWELDIDKLITFFRATDKTSAIVGKRQAITFSTLSALSGHRDLPNQKEKTKSSGKKSGASKQAAKTKSSSKPPVKLAESKGGDPVSQPKDFGLSVRIEVNLPADADKDTYDSIFKSIRENLVDVD